MEFKVDGFAANPTVEKLERCKKYYLNLIANYFDVLMPVNAKNQELKGLLWDKLSERGLFGEPAPAEEAEPGAMASIPAPLHTLPVQADMTTEELKLILRITEVEMRQRELKVEAMHLWLNALEVERGAAVVASPSTTQSPSQRSQGSFDVSRHIALVPPFRESEVDSYFNAFERQA